MPRTRSRSSVSASAEDCAGLREQLLRLRGVLLDRAPRRCRGPCPWRPAGPARRRADPARCGAVRRRRCRRRRAGSRSARATRSASSTSAGGEQGPGEQEVERAAERASASTEATRSTTPRAPAASAVPWPLTGTNPYQQPTYVPSVNTRHSPSRQREPLQRVEEQHGRHQRGDEPGRHVDRQPPQVPPGRRITQHPQRPRPPPRVRRRRPVPGRNPHPAPPHGHQPPPVGPRPHPRRRPGAW